MQQNENLIPDRNVIIDNDVQEFDKKFRPTGAIAFFMLLVILGLVIWFGIYFLMLSRS